MSILILNWKDIKNPHVGGAEIIAFELAKRLKKDGHSVTFFTRAFKGCLEEEVVEGIRVIRKGNKYTEYIHAFLYYIFLKVKPDKVIEMINTVCWQTPLYIPKEKRIGYVNQLAKEVWFYQQPFPISLVGYLAERFEYLFYKNTKFACYSQSTKDDLISFGIDEKNISMFPLGLDHTRYKPGGKKSSYPLFIFVARLVNMKRADVCIRALKKVIELVPNAKLAIIGTGPEENRLHRIGQKLGISESVLFINKNGFFFTKNPKDVKVKFMQSAWALVLPSAKEGWGMVVTEAAACGTPSIVSEVTGLRDSVVNNKTGLILSKYVEADELSDAMIRIIKEKKKREELSKNAIAWSRNFDWERSYARFKKILFQ